MAFVNPAQEGIALTTRGKIARPNGLGDFVLGYSQLGDYNLRAGVFQMRYPLLGEPGEGYNKHSTKIQVKMRYSWPNNPNSEIQQERRTKFRNGMIAWGNLTAEQQKAWENSGRRRGIRGSGYFMKRYMLDQPLNP